LSPFGILPILIAAVDDNVTLVEIRQKTFQHGISDIAMGQTEEDDFRRVERCAKRVVVGVLGERSADLLIFGLRDDSVHGFFGRVLKRHIAAIFTKEEGHAPSHAAAADHGHLSTVSIPHTVGD
jgi:hypothetical protein